MVKLADLRLDLTSLDAGAKVPIAVTATDQANTVGLGGTGGSGGISDSLTTASDGLTVTATKGDGLTCGSIEDALVTITEGFEGAWDPVRTDHVSPDGDKVEGAVQIRLEVSDFPDTEGAMMEWDKSADATTDEDVKIGKLTLDTTNSLESGRVVFYSYSQVDTVPDDATLTLKRMRGSKSAIGTLPDPSMLKLIR